MQNIVGKSEVGPLETVERLPRLWGWEMSVTGSVSCPVECISLTALKLLLVSDSLILLSLLLYKHISGGGGSSSNIHYAPEQ